MAEAGLMRGKRGLIMGVANNRSIAWGIAKAARMHGADLAFTYQGDALKKRVERFRRHGSGRRVALPSAAADPTGGAADKEGEQRHCGGKARPFAVGARDPLEIETSRHRFARGRAVARADRIRLRAPGCNTRRIIGMALEPFLDHGAFAARDLPVDIGVQLFFADRWLTIDHRSPHFTRRSAGRSPSR